MTINSFEVTAKCVYDPGQAPLELVTNDLLRNVFKSLLELSDYRALAGTSRCLQKKVQPILDAEWDRILKSITFGRDKWLNIPGVSTVSEEPLLTEKQLQDITSKCKQICEVFNEPDLVHPHRFQNGKVKKMWETHMLIFFPEAINNCPRTLNVIGRIFSFENKSNDSAIFSCIPSQIDPFCNLSPNGSYWRFVPRDLFPGTRMNPRRVKLVRGKGYLVPTPGDAATAILIMNLDRPHEKGGYFFGKGSEEKYPTYTATDQKYDNMRMIVGSYSLSNLSIFSQSDRFDVSVGVAGFSKVP